MISDKDKYVSMDVVKEILRQVKLDRERYVIFFPYIEEPKWRLVSERLPNEVDEYLVCYKDGSVSTDWYGLVDGFNENIVAWMPVPKPLLKSYELEANE